MNKERLAEIKRRVENISLAGWNCYATEDAYAKTIRFGNSFIEFPINSLHKSSFDVNTEEFILWAPQDMMELIEWRKNER